MIKRFLVTGRSGFYFSVIDPGDVGAGSKVEVLDRDPHSVTVADILAILGASASGVVFESEEAQEHADSRSLALLLTIIRFGLIP